MILRTMSGCPICGAPDARLPTSDDAAPVLSFRCPRDGGFEVATDVFRLKAVGLAPRDRWERALRSARRRSKFSELARITIFDFRLGQPQ
jgi:hypothetical protein